MELDATQKETVGGWVREGCGLSEIQKKLAEEFDLKLTFMDVRFLVLDLGLDLTEKEPTIAPDLDLASAPSAAASAGRAPLPQTAGGVSVEVDRLMKPGSLVSGNVTFSDGVTASWSLDQLGRLALQASTPDYRPSEEDLAAFQEELRAALEKHGF